MMTSRHIIPLVSILATGIVALGIYMAPSHTEIALMHMDDSDYSTAFKNFSNLHDAGDSSINVLAPLVNLNIYYGDIDKSIELMKIYVADHPATVEGRKRLAELYKSSQRLNNYCKILEELQTLAPSTENLRELADAYDFLGRYKDEMDALARLTARRDYRPVAEDYIRLASFYRADQKQDAAIKALNHYITDQDYKVPAEAVTIEIGLLINKGKAADARELALAYMKEDGKQENAVIIATSFENYAQFATAYEMLAPFASNLDGSAPEFEQQIVNLLLAQRKDDEVYTLLRGQYDRGTLPMVATVPLLDLAADRKDYDFVEAVLKKTQIAGLPEEVLLRYASLAAQTRRLDMATNMHDQLGTGYLQQAPLLNAVLNIALQDRPETINALLALPQELIDASSESRIVVAIIYLSHGLGKKAFALLQQIPLPDLLETMDAADMATLYLDANMASDGAQLLSAARPTSEPKIQAVIDGAIMLLDVGQGKDDAVQQEIKNFTDKNADLFADAFSIALQYHRDDLAVVFAQRIYQAVPDTQNRLQLADALLRVGRLTDALPHLQIPTEKDPATRALYLGVIEDWIERAGFAKLPEAQKQAFQKLLAEVAQSPALTPAQSLEFAYSLEEAGMFNQAERLFVKAANGQSSGSREVAELLNFWEVHPSPATTGWIENRARASSDAEQVAWLTVLNDMGYAQSVLNVMHDGWNASPALADQYIAALITAHEQKQLETTLDQAIEAETNVPRIKQLINVAEQEDIPTVSAHGWSKVHQLDPADSEALLNLGTLAYDANRFDEAGPLLAQYLQQNTGSYQTNYAYGDILEQADKKAEATVYYERALTQLADVKDLDEEALTDKAYLLFATDKIQQSVVLFRQLIEQHPENKTLQADLADILMEAGRYDETTKLLAQ